MQFQLELQMGFVIADCATAVVAKLNKRSEMVPQPLAAAMHEEAVHSSHEEVQLPMDKVKPKYR